MTVITYGFLVQRVLEAARALESDGHSIEVLDIRTIVPLDKEAVLASARKTGKVLVAHEDSVFAGFGAEIAAQVSELAFEQLDAPVRRLGSKHVHIGFSPVLEKVTLPQPADILSAMRELLEY